ncbi:HvfC/BufC N-terminal domain-containing protein [Sphingomonas quercus]|uniref:DNA-binding domain-containing protein n=1 Tax=Sphingomonas quercus TaxID=2842451 RepID=A0ABS6BHT0_9SPHN|nr:DNA-binding domain-containing protein [Sphingomonas quercus]MBU3077858.1 DNA-binding domain-containing protein [Sphingomonas quercus]
MTLRALQHGFRDWLTSESGPLAGRYPAGLAVYLNTYRAQLMACLSDSYPMLVAWLGEAAFAAAAATHIDGSPPHGWTLDAYALDFPVTLDGLYPEDPEVAELARLECGLGLAFVGPDAAAVDPSRLGNVDWEAAALHLAPTFRLLPATTNAAAIWSALAAGERPPPAERLPQAASIAIWRQGFTPLFRTLEAEEGEALALIRAGHGFGALCAALVERLGEEHGPARAGAFLGRWLGDGLIVDVN